MPGREPGQPAAEATPNRASARMRRRPARNPWSSARGAKAADLFHAIDRGGARGARFAENRQPTPA